MKPSELGDCNAIVNMTIATMMNRTVIVNTISGHCDVLFFLLRHVTQKILRLFMEIKVKGETIHSMPKHFLKALLTADEEILSLSQC
jgi:hypothetical protein